MSRYVSFYRYVPYTLENESEDTPLGVVGMYSFTSTYPPLEVLKRKFHLSVSRYTPFYKHVPKVERNTNMYLVVQRIHILLQICTQEKEIHYVLGGTVGTHYFTSMHP